MQNQLITHQNNTNQDQLQQTNLQYKNSLITQFKQLQQIISNSNKNKIPQRQQDQYQIQSQSKKNQITKLKFRKLKQRLQSLCLKHDEFSFGKQIASANKPRIMKLSIQLQKQVNNQIKDLSQIQNIMKQFLKLVQQKKQNDLHVIRQSKFIPSIMEFFKKLLSSHKNEYRDSIKILEVATKILTIFCCYSINRQYMIITNRIHTLIGLLKWGLNKKQQIYQISSSKFLTMLFNILSNLFEHNFESESNSIIHQTIQYIFFSQIIRKIKFSIESSINQQGVCDENLLKSISRFFNSLLKSIVQKEQQNSIDEMMVVSQNCTYHIQLLGQTFMQLINNVIFDKDNNVRQRYLADSTISILIYSFNLLNLCNRINFCLIQRFLDDQFLNSIIFLLKYCNYNFEQSLDIVTLLNHIIMAIGYLALENFEIQSKIYQTQINSELINLPTKYTIDKKSHEIHLPTLFSLIFRHKKNFQFILKDLSVNMIKKYLQMEMQNNNTQGSARYIRKYSMSSLNSTNTQSSLMTLQKFEKSSFELRKRFPIKYWQEMYESFTDIQ